MKPPHAAGLFALLPQLLAFFDTQEDPAYLSRRQRSVEACRKNGEARSKDLRESNMKIKSIMLAIVCAIGLSGCETMTNAWDSVFGMNNAPASVALAQDTQAQ